MTSPERESGIKVTDLSSSAGSVAGAYRSSPLSGWPSIGAALALVLVGVAFITVAGQANGQSGQADSESSHAGFQSSSTNAHSGQAGGQGGNKPPAGIAARRPQHGAGLHNNIRGTRRADRLHGTRRADLIAGGGGDDDLYGGRGKDRLYGGRGRDRLRGGEGADRLSGASGRDILRGGSGNDRLRGGRGSDRLSGGTGKDRLRGDSGNDRLYGGGGRDALFGGSGEDVLAGGSGRDRIYGGRGRDRIRGGSGNDRIFARGGGRDRIDCGPGYDVVDADRRDRVRGCEKLIRSGRSAESGEGDEPAALPPPNGPPPNGPPSDHGNSPGRPNIIFIVSDDQRYDGVTERFMPNLWGLLKRSDMRSLWFNNGFITRALCCPSRASILAGQYAHNTRVLSNDWYGGDYKNHPVGSFRAFNDSETVATWLKRAGYRTGLVGKYLNGYGSPEGFGGKPAGPLYVPPGWDTFRVFTRGSNHNGPAYYNYTLNIDGNRLEVHGDVEDDVGTDYSTDVFKRYALDFIDSASQDARPFFLELSPYAPHSPNTPAPRYKDELFGYTQGYFDKYCNPERDLPGNDDEGPCPPSYNEADVSDKPAWVRSREPMGKKKIKKMNEARLAKLRSARSIDDAIGAVVAALDDVGELDNTYIFYISDNGYLYGEHRAIHKRYAYQESARVPFIVIGPNVARYRNGKTDLIAANIDLAPTFAELAGASLPDPGTHAVDGRSLVPVIEGRASGWRTDLLIEHWTDKTCGEGPMPTFKALYSIRGGTPYKYVQYETTEGSKGPCLRKGRDPLFQASEALYWLRGQGSSLAGEPEGGVPSILEDFGGYSEPGFGDKPERELYDLSRDPYEEVSIHASEPELVGELDARLNVLGSCKGEVCR